MQSRVVDRDKAERPRAHDQHPNPRPLTTTRPGRSPHRTRPAACGGIPAQIRSVAAPRLRYVRQESASASQSIRRDVRNGHDRADPHKETHSAVAIDPLGRGLSKSTEPAVQDGFRQLLLWARALAHERLWVVGDCRHVSGPFERFLIDHGEPVVRLPPRMMAGARDTSASPANPIRSTRWRSHGRALRGGIETLPPARLAGPALEIRLLCAHRQGLWMPARDWRTSLRWELHDLWPGWRTSRARLRSTTTQLADRPPLDSFRTDGQSQDRPRYRPPDPRSDLNDQRSSPELAELVNQVAPQLLAEKGLGAITAAKLIGEIAGADRFENDANSHASPERASPVSSGRTDRYRLDRGGNRQLNCALHRLAVNKGTGIPMRPPTSPANKPKANRAKKHCAASNATSPDASGSSCDHPPRPTRHRSTPRRPRGPRPARRSPSQPRPRSHGLREVADQHCRHAARSSRPSPKHPPTAFFARRIGRPTANPQTALQRADLRSEPHARTRHANPHPTARRSQPGPARVPTIAQITANSDKRLT